MEHLSEGDLWALNELGIQNPQQALAVLRQYETRFAGDENFEANKAAFYIDIGTELGDAEVIRHGISLIERDLQASRDKAAPSRLYNLANGYSSLHGIEQRVSKASFDPDGTSLVKAKNFYRDAIAAESGLRHDLRTQLWINYGNCLSGLGRSVEAIEAFNRALRLDRTHPMALGNLGMELHYFAYLAQHPLFLLDALDMLDQALADERLERIGGQHSRRAFEETRQAVADEIAQAGIDRSKVKSPRCPEFIGIHGEYVQFCARNDLFLNFCLDCRRCGSYAKDSLSFSLTTKLGDDTTFVRLSRVINTVKERYAFARFLLFQSQQPLVNTLPIDQMTTYVDNLDYAVYGTPVASLKSAFEGAYGVLDVMAHFVNSYLDLSIPSDRVSFTSIWKAKKTATLRDEIRRLDNRHLFGLYDLARDLHVDDQHRNEDGHWGHLRRIRNRLAHEYVIPHVEGMHWEEEIDGAECHLNYRDLVKDTIAILQLARGAIIYLMAFLDQEERKRKQAASGRVVTFPITRYDAKLFRTAIGV